MTHLSHHDLFASLETTEADDQDSEAAQNMRPSFLTVVYTYGFNLASGMTECDVDAVRWLGNDQNLQLDMQKPFICLEPSFVLTILNFFVPSYEFGTSAPKVIRCQKQVV